MILSLTELEQVKQVASKLLILGMEGLQPSQAFRAILPEIAGVILFDRSKDQQTKNIISAQQVQQLNRELLALNPQLLISVDHEGGRDRQASGERFGVTRLRPDAGFPVTLSAKEMGDGYRDLCFEKDRAQADRWLSEVCYHNAVLLKKLGFNCVYAPVVDVHDPACPIIGAIHRAYSDDCAEIITLARAQLLAYQRAGIWTCLKHYPGHGRAHQDSHLGLTDISDYWQQDELSPYQALAKHSQMIMLGHLFLKQVDPVFPASLSPRHGKELREYFSGVIISDDLQMAGVVDFIDQIIPGASKLEQLSKTLELALNAGNDLLLYGCQLDPESPISFYQDYLSAMVALVKSGQVSFERLQASASRVARLQKASQ